MSFVASAVVNAAHTPGAWSQTCSSSMLRQCPLGCTVSVLHRSLTAIREICRLPTFASDGRVVRARMDEVRRRNTWPCKSNTLEPSVRIVFVAPTLRLTYCHTPCLVLLPPLLHAIPVVVCADSTHLCATRGFFCLLSFLCGSVE